MIRTRTASYCIFAIGILLVCSPSAMGKTVFVSGDASGSETGASWANACPSISAGLVAAASGDQIWVKSGTYNERFTIVPGVEIYGGFAGTESDLGSRDWALNETTIDATDLNGYAVIVENDVTLDGFTIVRISEPNGIFSGNGGVSCVGANATVKNCTITGFASYGGAGLYCAENAHPTLVNCVISENYASTGGAVLCSPGSGASLIDCILADNYSAASGGGIACEAEADVTLDGCEISGNEAQDDGGGCWSFRATLTLRDCVIENNSSLSGGGIYSINGSAVTLENCTLRNNSNVGFGNYYHYSGGGVFSDSSGLKMSNCLLSGNSSTQAGGAIAQYDSYVEIVNCTLVNNRAPLGSGLFGDSYDDPPVTVENSIIWNPGQDISLSGYGEPIITHCCVQGGWPGEGNIDGYPMFMDMNAENYRLLTKSPCIDRGSIGSAPSTDLDGRERPGSDGLVDMGAYESWPGLTHDAGDGMHTPGTLYVSLSAGANGDGSTWQKALPSVESALAVSGVSDEIWVAAGRYNGPVFMEPSVDCYGGFAGNETSKEQRDPAANETIIDATGSNTHAVTCTGTLLLDGFTITGGNAEESGGGIYCLSANLKLSQCRISGNQAGEGGGFYAEGPCELTFDECTIEENVAAWEGGGCYLEYDTTTIMTGCRILNNTAGSSGGGIASSDTLTVINSIIAGNRAELGGAVWSYLRDEFINCTIVNNSALTYGGIDFFQHLTLSNCILWNQGKELNDNYPRWLNVNNCCVQDGAPGAGNITAYPDFLNLGEGDYHLKNGSPCIDRGDVALAPDTDIEGNERPGGDGLADIGAYESEPDFANEGGDGMHVPSVVYVDGTAAPGGDGKSWTSALGSISEAFFVAGVSDELWVRQGTYPESVQCEPGIALFGGFAGTETRRQERDWVHHETIIDAEGVGQSAVMIDRDTTLDGFTVTGGEAEYGGGIYGECVRSTVRNCTVRNNSASTLGGGLCCANGAIENCTIEDNSSRMGGGIACFLGALPILKGCLIRNNDAEISGGGVSAFGYSLEIEDCVIIGNSVGFEGQASGGGLHLDCVMTTLTNCLIADNSAGIYGGAIYTNERLRLDNCTLAGNAAMAGCGIFSDWLVTMNNCISWNPGQEVISSKGRAPRITASHSCMQGGSTDEGNINSYPEFVDPNSGDYRLADGSPCIDRGSIALAPDTDITGTERPGGDGLVDMGAYESSATYENSGGDGIHKPTVYYVNGSVASSGDGLSWATSFKTIGEASRLTSDSDLVLVAAGRYGESVRMEESVALTGGFLAVTEGLAPWDPEVNETIIDATGVDGSAVYGAASSLVDGFTITGGNAKYGGGVFSYAADTMLANCIVTRNSASAAGGGVYNTYGAEHQLTNCTIENNTAYASGGVCVVSGTPTLVDCRVRNNDSVEEGGGAVFLHACAEMTYCTFSGNSSGNGGGLLLLESDVQLAHCEIGGASAYLGGGLGLWDSIADLTNCIIAGNTATSSGGANYSVRSTMSFTNCTIAGNSVVDQSGAVSDFRSQAAASYTNSILWNSGPELAAYGSVENITATYSCIRNGWPGAGNISTDPGFVHSWDGSSADLHLLPSSPCIDAGTDIALVTDDFEGTARGDIPGIGFDGGSGHDMGAFEYFANFTNTPTMTPTATPTPPLSDIDGNGRTEYIDLLFLARWWDQPVNETNYRCDVERDNRIDRADLVRILSEWE